MAKNWYAIRDFKVQILNGIYFIKWIKYAEIFHEIHEIFCEFAIENAFIMSRFMVVMKQNFWVIGTNVCFFKGVFAEQWWWLTEPLRDMILHNAQI